MKLIQNIQFGNELEYLTIEKIDSRYYANYYGDVSAGFPSPAEDFRQERISLDERFLNKPESTFLVRVGGLSMHPYYQINDVLVNRSDYQLMHGDDAVVSINNSDFTLKRWDANKKMFYALNPDFKDCLIIQPEDVVVCLGVVSTIIRELKRFRK